MDEHEHHKSLIDGIKNQFAQILNTSKQGVYIYLDDNHKLCNDKFAKMLGYNSPEEWAKITDSFPQTFVAKESQDTLIKSFQDAMENCFASENNISWKKKDGTKINTNVILVPVAYNNHLMALHFVSG